MRKILAVIVVVLGLAACGPSDEEFTSSCLARCINIVQCGFGVPDGWGSCGEYCYAELAAMEEQSSDCAWYATYWFDCQADLQCFEFETHCMGRLADVAAYCGG